MTNKKLGCLVLLGIFLFVVIIVAIVAITPEETGKIASIRGIIGDNHFTR